MKITIERDGKLYSVPKFSVDIGFNYINIETKYMELIETKPEEKPQFDDSQLLIGRNTYNPFTTECKEIPEEKLTEEERIMEACKPYLRGTVEKPTYWYIETEEMKKSEYWEVFKEWFDGKALLKWTPKYTEPRYGYSIELGYTPLVCGYECLPKLSPQQWYDTIYDGDKPCQHESDGQVYLSNPVQYKCKKCGKFYRNEWKTETVLHHDKAMEIAEVPELKIEREYQPGIVYNLTQEQKHLELLTNSLNAVIKKINNL